MSRRYRRREDDPYIAVLAGALPLVAYSEPAGRTTLRHVHHLLATAGAHIPMGALRRLLLDLGVGVLRDSVTGLAIRPHSR